MTEQDLIKILIGVITTMGGGIFALVLALHKGMTKRLDIIDIDLKPILRKVDVHEAEIQGLKSEQKEINSRLNSHEVILNSFVKK